MPLRTRQQAHHRHQAVVAQPPLAGALAERARLDHVRHSRLQLRRRQGHRGGSFTAERLDELYVSPYDIGYGFAVRFDHDFIGRESLEAMAGTRHRKKARLVWIADDILDIAPSLSREGVPYKCMEMPVVGYATYCFDEVLHGETQVGLSNQPVYSTANRAWISLARVDEFVAADGTEVSIVWGEADGGLAKPNVESHHQKVVRARIDSEPTKRH